MCDFNFFVQDKLQYHTDQLSASDIVRVHFLILVMHKKVMRFELEDALTRCIDELTLDHMGLIAQTYRSFDKNVKHKDVILGAMICKLKTESKTANSFTICAILEVSGGS